jgi:hypothetical protein
MSLRTIVMSKTFSEFCIYTIKQSEELEQRAKNRQPATFTVRRSWATGERLWLEAVTAKKAMPVLLGDATDCSRLLYWGFLTDVRVDSDETSFSVDQVRPMKGKHSPQELILRSIGKRIKPKFIRPYAICRTPEFLT